MIKFFGYKKCSTCRKAELFLTKHQVAYEFIDITLTPPSSSQLKKILTLTGLPLKRLFNTSGLVYRQLGLKDKVESMSTKEALDLLAKNGKLVKRPLVLSNKTASIGFREDVFQDSWG